MRNLIIADNEISVILMFRLVNQTDILVAKDQYKGVGDRYIMHTDQYKGIEDQYIPEFCLYIGRKDQYKGIGDRYISLRYLYKHIFYQYIGRI